MQLIAMVTMLVDHLGIVFFSDNVTFRIIGRIAFPLYCWFLVQGFIHTSSHKRYMRRLFFLACISQVPYTLALGNWELNVIFTLFISLVALYSIEIVSNELVKWALFAGALATITIFPMDYGLYGLLLTFIIRHFSQWKMVGAHMVLNLLFLLINGPGYWIQLLSITGTLLIAYPIRYTAFILPKWLYRGFYPIHLGILHLIDVFTG